MDQLDRSIRALYGNSGPVDRDDLISILHEILARIQALEEARKQ